MLFLLQAEAYKLQQKDKLRQLELGGLVDYQPAADPQQQQQQPEDGQASPAKRRKAAGSAEQQQQHAEQAGIEQQPQQKQKGKGKGKQSTDKGRQAAAAAKKKQSAAAADGEEAGGAHATFIVIGSTGNHYVVKLSDAKRSCTCMDHR
jgi:DNA mismatch repair ATPase MutL